MRTSARTNGEKGDTTATGAPGRATGPEPRPGYGKVPALERWYAELEDLWTNHFETCAACLQAGRHLCPAGLEVTGELVRVRSALEVLRSRRVTGGAPTSGSWTLAGALA